MKESDDKRKAILASATRIFSEKSFVEATMNEIAGGAGLGNIAEVYRRIIHQRRTH